LERRLHDHPPIYRLPLIPEHVLKQHKVLEPTDNRFRATARLLQALWREDRNLPIGTHISRDGSRRKLGSRISNEAGRAGANFLSREISYLARREVIYRELGALIDEDRLYTNLLSSMPLTFNLFGPLRLDLALATRVLHLLVPELRGAIVTAVWFEHSPGRGAPSLTHDGTAFDAFLIYEHGNRRCFLAIETKYSETGWEPVADLRPRYDEISTTSGLFIDPNSPALRTAPLQQLWREHLLCHAMLARGDYDEGLFLVIAPRLNHLMQNVIGAYRCQLNDPTTPRGGFASMTLEALIEAIGSSGEEDYARALHRRYTDFLLVDGEIELALTTLPSSARRSAAENTEQANVAPADSAPAACAP
jgi:hypothetical protein